MVTTFQTIGVILIIGVCSLNCTRNKETNQAARNSPIVINGMKINAFHTAEMALEQRIVYYPESEDLSKLMSAYWATFARNGNPNKDGLPLWPAYTKDQRATMIFNLESKVVNDPDREERLLFENFQ